jgi:hypothetical protein
VYEDYPSEICLSPATPPGGFFSKQSIPLGELLMIKNYRLAIDLIINISEEITPQLIEQLKTENSEYNSLSLEQENLDKLQAIISTIIKNENHHADCLLGAITFKLTSQGFDDVLENPEIVDHTIVKAAAELGAEYEAFAKQLYKADEDDTDNESQYDDEEPDETGTEKMNIFDMFNTREAEIEMAEEERNMLRAVLQACLLEPQITDAKVIALPDDNNA